MQQEFSRSQIIAVSIARQGAFPAVTKIRPTSANFGPAGLVGRPVRAAAKKSLDHADLVGQCQAENQAHQAGDHG